MEEKKTELKACPYAKKCGGCQYQGVPYPAQLKKKQNQVQNLLKKFGKVKPVIGMKDGKAIEFAGLIGKEKVIDAYCGIGTIGLVAAGKAKEVIGIELNKDAVKDAKINARENKAGNISFRQGDAGEFMEAMAAKGEKADVVFMDPPRSGSSEKFLNSLIKLSPDKIVYISCNPETLARDLLFLTRKSYEVKEIQPVEMFCFTDHTEVVTWLSRK